ncbi:MAG: ATPase [Saprospiraceae bacterium]|nr:MAG: ATPase [Saprospiraceae bacterium]
MATQNNYQLLIEKLDQFIRKYYINQLIRGALYSIALIVVLFLTTALMEYNFYFDTSGRKLLFYSFIGVSAIALAGWVFLPLLRYFRLGSVISHEQAAQIIGNHFTDVKDKLLNILQLRQQADQSGQKDLILASIDQKSEEIKPIPFRSAINLNQNRKYLRYALPPLFLLLILLLAAPSMLRDSTDRLIHNNRKYVKPAPFHFTINEEELSVVQFEDYPLTVKIEGEELPNEVFIDVDNYQYRLTKEAPNLFSYRFSNVQKSTDFKLFSGKIASDEYTLDVLKKPNLLGFEVKLDYPAYTQRTDEELKSIGDMVVPIGTNIDWVFNAQNTDAIDLRFSGVQEKEPSKRFSDELFTYKRRALKDESYRLYVSNEALPNADSINYTITIIPDLYPNIKVEKFQDSTDQKLLFFVGDASDDYGLLSLSFNYRIKHESDKEEPLKTIKLKKPEGRQVRYDHTFAMSDLELKPGDEVSFYFEVFDNDAVNGSKSARTGLMVFNMPTLEEYEDMAEANDKEIKKDLKKALDESRKIQEDMKKMREKILQEKEMDWQSRKELEKLLDRQKDLEKQLENAKEKFDENRKNEEEFSKTQEKIQEKQEKLEQLFEEVMSEEMKELMKQIEELLQEIEKDNALEMMEEMEMSDEEMEMELDRLLELYKQLEVEKEMQDIVKKLEELAEEQDKLSEETEKAENKEDQQNGEEGKEEDKKTQEELEKKQEEINEEFDKLQEKMEETEKKNEELESPKELGDYDEEMEDIEEELDQSQEQLQQQQNNKASKSQKKASQKMKSMAMDMQMQMESGEMEQLEEDMDALRQLLENLVGMSFDQEDLISDFNNATINTPKYVELVQEQFKLKDDFRLIEDSLQALSKRVFQIESFVTEKVSEIKNNMKESLEDLEERRKTQASDHQQRIMKNTNDLALMLSEVMNQMQQQMSGMMSGSQMCNKPGQKGKSGSVPKDKMGKSQEELNQQMKNTLEKMKKGKGASSKEFAEMAAKQAAMRKALREQQQEKQQKGQGGDKELQDLIEQMDKTETDLVNKKLTNEMMKRQQEILTRLLKHEKAEREREYEEKRKAETGSQKERKMPPSLEEYIKKREAEIEMYKTVSPSLKPYYKFLVEEYFKNLKGEGATK